MDKPYSKEELIQLILEVMGLKAITPMLVKQINNACLQYGMSYKEIARCIVWYTEVAKKQVSPLYGIWFVPNVREETKAYFEKLELDQQRQAEEAQKVVQYQDNNIIFNIKAMKHEKKKPKQFNIGEIKIEGDSNNG